jgi:hypothetical protein
MNTPLGVSGVLKRHKGLLTTSLKAAVIAVPVLLSAAPSQAATVSKTFTGFTGAFAPANWTVTGGSQTASALTLNRAATVGTSTGTWALNATTLQALIDDRPVNAKPIFEGGEFTFTWAWTPSGNLTTSSGSRNAFTFTMVNNGIQAGSLPISGARTGNVAVTQNSADPAGTVAGIGDNLQFSLARGSSPTGASTTVTSTGVITDFSFTAFYEEVPGPLPLAGAAAAFAWSRRLRRRLNSAESVA